MSTIEGPQIISGGKLKIPSGKLSIVTPVIPPPPFSNSYSLLFDGSGDYVTSFGTGGGSAFTISFWLNMAIGFIGTYSWVFSNSSPASQGGIAVWIYYGITENRYIKVSCHSNVGGAFGNAHGSYEEGVNDYEYDEWILFTMNWNGTTLKAYKNATEIVSTTSGVADPGMGTMYIGQNGYNGGYHLGYIDEFAYWDAVLSPSAVTAIYNSGTPIDLTSNSGNYTNSGDLQRYLRLEEGSGTVATDTTGNDNGIITAATYSSTVPS